MHYQLFSEGKEEKNYGAYTAYGIEAVGKGCILCRVEDISVERSKMLLLIERFNREKLELSHLEQAVEEFLYDFEV